MIHCLTESHSAVVNHSNRLELVSKFNTEAMANAVADGAKAAGAEVDLTDVDSTSADKIADYDAIAFGCPAMGDEVLEEGSFEPYFTEAEGKISGKTVALFGSWGWGNGVYMKDWSKRTQASGAKVIGTFVCQDAPDDDAVEECKKLGAKLA